MDNFEKRMYLKYVIALASVIRFKNYNSDDFLNDIYDSFRIKVNPPERNKDFNTYLSKFKDKLQKKLDKIKPVKTITEKKIDILSKMYRLDNVEREILTLIILIDKTMEISNWWNIIDGNKDFYNFRKYYLKIKSQEAIHKKYEALCDKGLITRHKDLNNKVSEIFYRSNIKTEEQIIKIMLGKTQKSELEWSDFDYMQKERNLVANIIDSANKTKAKGINILLYGEPGTGKTEFSKLVTDKLGINLYSVKSDDRNVEAERRDRISDLLSKQTILNSFDNSCILFDEAEDLFNRDYSSKAFLNKILEENIIPIFWTTNNIHGVDPAVLRRMTYAIRFEKHSEEVRLKIWKNILRKNKLNIEASKVIELNKNYNVSTAIITNAVKTTKLINGSTEEFECFLDNVAQVVAKKKSIKKESVYKSSEYNDALVNTDLNLKDLTDKICDCNKLNFSLCLYGEPGTGKSLYARHLADRLGVEVILKRASDLMSMWVGQTEQNIADAFKEAKNKKAMLIFDEADTFLQSRGNAQRSWEISQVNEMLTWMESHNYPFVCTTNLLDTLDEASLRRFTFKIKFDYMTQEQVNTAVEHFFGIKDSKINIKGLTAGDFATVKKKADFLEIKDIKELEKMLYDEVKVKNSSQIKNVVGF